MKGMKERKKERTKKRKKKEERTIQYSGLPFYVAVSVYAPDFYHLPEAV